MSGTETAKGTARMGRAGRPKAQSGDKRSARKGERREAILAAALDEFSARGFADARLDDVAVRAGVAKGTIYLYFPDKESLFQELVRTMLTPIVGAIAAAPGAGPAGARGRRDAGQRVREPDLPAHAARTCCG